MPILVGEITIPKGLTHVFASFPTLVSHFKVVVARLQAEELQRCCRWYSNPVSQTLRILDTILKIMST